MPLEPGAVAAAACGAGRFLPVASALRGCSVSLAWRDGLEEVLGEAETVDLRSQKVDDVGAVSLLGKCPRARSVNLSDCRRLTDSTAASLAHACPKLRELNLTGNPHVTPKGIDEVVRHCAALESLYLAGCDKIPEHVLLKRYSRFCDIFDEDEEGPWAA